MMKRVVCLVCFLLATVALYGCGKDNGKVDPPPVGSIQNLESIDVDIYLDGTYSMAGYVNFSGTTVYVDSLKNIERTLTSAWKRDNIQYIKFGDDIKKLDRGGFLRANNVGFYQETDTSLQKVVNYIDEKKMSIIITDLFQTNQDIDSLVKSLKIKCFADENKALALIGVKSEFNGKIYDVGKNLISFTYSTTADKASFRPFYILVIGKEIDVRRFAQNFGKYYDDIDIYKIVLFSKNLNINNLMIAGKRGNDKNKDKIATMAKISTLLGSDSNVLQYRLKLDEKKSSVNCVLKLKEVVGQVPEKLDEWSFVLEKWNHEEKEEKKKGLLDKLFGNKANQVGQKSFKPLKADSFMEVDSDKMEADNGVVSIPIRVVVNPSAIKKTKGKYRVCFNIYPSKEEYIANNRVFSEWSFADNQISRDKELKFCGNKTLNVESFVNVISSLNYELNRPGIYNNYIYLEAVK